MAGSTKEGDTQRRRALYRLVAARSDIGAAHGIAEYGRDHIKDLRDELWIPLQDAMVIAYARPFTSNKPVGRLPNKWSRFGNQGLQRLHDDLISMRDRLVAHGDASERRIIVYPPGATLTAGLPRSDGAAVALATMRPYPEHFARVAKLCLDLGSRLHDAVESELQSLYGQGSGRSTAFDLLTNKNVKIDAGGGKITAVEQRHQWRGKSATS